MINGGEYEQLSLLPELEAAQKPEQNNPDQTFGHEVLSCINPGTVRYFGSVDGIGGGLPEDSGATDLPPPVRPPHVPHKTGHVRDFESDRDYTPSEPYSPQTAEEKRAYEKARPALDKLHEALAAQALNDSADNDPLLRAARLRAARERRQ